MHSTRKPSFITEFQSIGPEACLLLVQPFYFIPKLEPFLNFGEQVSECGLKEAAMKIRPLKRIYFFLVSIPSSRGEQPDPAFVGQARTGLPVWTSF
jgi:hypothetical protein